MRSQSVCSRVAFSISCYVVLPVISAFASASADGHGDAHGGGHGFTWFDWAAQPGAPVGFGYLLLNFVVLLIALNFLIFRPLRKGNAEKSDRIRAELEKGRPGKRGHTGKSDLHEPAAIERTGTANGRGGGIKDRGHGLG